MSKINLKMKLISNEENLDLEISGIRTKNKIVYKENNIIVTLFISNNKIEMNRICNEYNIKLLFDKNKITTSTYTVFGSNKIFDLETKTNKLIITDSSIKIDYVLEGNKFIFSLLIGG